MAGRVRRVPAATGARVPGGAAALRAGSGPHRAHLLPRGHREGVSAARDTPGAFRALFVLPGLL